MSTTSTVSTVVLNQPIRRQPMTAIDNQHFAIDVTGSVRTEKDSGIFNIFD